MYTFNIKVAVPVTLSLNIFNIKVAVPITFSLNTFNIKFAVPITLSLNTFNIKVAVPITLSLTVMISYICGGAILFGEWEGWNFLDGFYFCFISLRDSTIKIHFSQTFQGQIYF